MTKYEVTITDHRSNVILGPLMFEFSDLWTAVREVTAAYYNYDSGNAAGLTVRRVEETNDPE